MQHNNFGQTAVHISVLNDQSEILQILLDRDFATEADLRGMTPLHFAVLRDNHKIVTMLLDKERSRTDRPVNSSKTLEIVNTPQEDLFTPVHYACHRGNLNIL